MAAVIDAEPRSAYLPGVAEDIIRDAIMAEVERRGLNAYQLWKLVEGKVSRTTVYQFMTGNTSLTTETATHILSALSLSFRKHK